MKNQFVPFELAVKLKEIGFNFYPFGYYSLLENNKLLTSNFYASDDFLEAPLWQQAFDWFRKEHGLVGYIAQDLNPTPEPSKWFFAIQKSNLSNETGHLSRHCYKTYEDARLECLEQLIKLVNKN